MTINCPPFLLHCQTVTQELIPHNSYCLYNNEMCRTFIKNNFSDCVLSSYDKLNPYAYRSDLARYCLLYELGGWYLDIALKPLIRMQLKSEVQCLVFRECLSIAGGSWGISNSALYTAPRNPIFLTAINLIVENSTNKYYGLNALDPTGPNLLGRALVLCNQIENTIFGDTLLLTPNSSNKNKAMVLPTGDIFAFSKPAAGGDLSALGAKGTNNYVNLYNLRQVYKQ